MSFLASSLKSLVRLRAIFVLSALAFFFTACASNEYSYTTTVSGGEQVRFTMVAGRPKPAKAEGVEILEAGLQPDVETKKVLYGFRFSDSRVGRVWQNV